MRIAARWDKQVEHHSCPEKWIPYDTLDIHEHAHYQQGIRLRSGPLSHVSQLPAPLSQTCLLALAFWVTWVPFDRNLAVAEADGREFDKLFWFAGVALFTVYEYYAHLTFFIEDILIVVEKLLQHWRLFPCRTRQDTWGLMHRKRCRVGAMCSSVSKRARSGREAGETCCRRPTGSAKFAVSKRSPPDRDRDRSHSSRVSAHRQSSGVTDREPEYWWPTITLPSVALLRTCCVEVGGGCRFCGALGCLFPTHVILWTYGQDL
ncbi:uncharacterized protein CLUP02_10907 [Colletotrichum lupini]|uniref:Uncharacterized protein n=1 Tax=Colletotrichum lupini TaxID=145971 RepID=A0A9Q8SXU9_9PEZI|nr:uncharacterized protein CLUP02_10907 [Colletotrichum lupini]KAK1715665.1 hypothetical protein BDP67DRAFT_284075 [Colletotrichum lupini]UQC85410.1 hypothetical protein CLUP02_10907 [Colletotrichum lupini]